MTVPLAAFCPVAELSARRSSSTSVERAPPHRYAPAPGAGKAGTSALCSPPSSLRRSAPAPGAGKAGTSALCSPPSSLRLMKAVPDAAHGEDVPRLTRIGLELLPQMTDVD